MTEQEYITAGNLRLVIAVGSIMRDMLPGDEYGIPEDEFRQVSAILSRWRTGLFAAVEATVSEGHEDE